MAWFVYIKLHDSLFLQEEYDELLKYAVVIPQYNPGGSSNPVASETASTAVPTLSTNTSDVGTAMTSSTAHRSAKAGSFSKQSAAHKSILTTRPSGYQSTCEIYQHFKNNIWLNVFISGSVPKGLELSFLMDLSFVLLSFGLTSWFMFPSDLCTFSCLAFWLILLGHYEFWLVLFLQLSFYESWTVFECDLFNSSSRYNSV